MSWKNTIIIGVVLGSVLGFASYTALSHIGSEMLLQSTYEPYTIQTVQGCGLEPESACDSLAYLYYSSLVMPDNVKMQPLDAVVNNGGMQPFAPAQEDELTATQRLQDTSSPQVTQHGYFIQATANSGRLQGTTAVSGRE